MAVASYLMNKLENHINFLILVRKTTAFLITVWNLICFVFFFPLTSIAGMQWVMNLENRICSISHTDDSYSFKPAMAKKKKKKFFTCPNSYHLYGNVVIQKINGMGVLTNLILKYCWSDLQVNLDWTISSGSVFCRSNFWLLDMNAALFSHNNRWLWRRRAQRLKYSRSISCPERNESAKSTRGVQLPPTEQTKD